MPNWVTNRVVAKDYDKLYEALIDEAGEVDFNILKPLSKDLDIQAGSGEYLTRLDYMPNEKILEFQKNKLDVFLQDRYNSDITQEQFVDRALVHLLGTKLEQEIKEVYGISDLGQRTREAIVNILKGYFNVQRYGYNNWYNAHINEWGTKWNADNTYCNGEEICFQTAWSTPIGIWEELSKRTPIIVAFADEDTGSNCGIVKFENGHAVSEFGSEDENKSVSVGFAIAIQGNDIEEISEMFDEDTVEKYFETDMGTFEAIATQSYNETLAVLSENGFSV